jgi:predicted regulator of Ras-like GTPase activity (Roadblock/LC7/MglB family)
VDAQQALADLTEISSQIEAVVLTDDEGAILGSNLADEPRATQFAERAARLLAEAGSAAAGGREGAEPAQLEAATPEGSVFVVREGGRTIAATTSPEPTVGLVFYDLKSCLRSLDAAADKPAARRTRKPKEPADGAA